MSWHRLTLINPAAKLIQNQTNLIQVILSYKNRQKKTNRNQDDKSVIE